MLDLVGAGENHQEISLSRQVNRHRCMDLRDDVSHGLEASGTSLHHTTHVLAVMASRNNAAMHSTSRGSNLPPIDNSSSSTLPSEVYKRACTPHCHV